MRSSPFHPVARIDHIRLQALSRPPRAPHPHTAYRSGVPQTTPTSRTERLPSFGSIRHIDVPRHPRLTLVQPVSHPWDHVQDACITRANEARRPLRDPSQRRRTYLATVAPIRSSATARSTGRAPVGARRAEASLRHPSRLLAHLQCRPQSAVPAVGEVPPAPAHASQGSFGGIVIDGIVAPRPGGDARPAADGLRHARSSVRCARR